MTTIIDLPNEILDKVFGYFAWSPQLSLIPSNPDITNISLTCRTLRDAALPTLFRNVRLTLRWVDGAIAEPGIYRLRQQAPHISKLVRCVHIKIKFGQEQSWRFRPFTLPLALKDWAAASLGDSASSEIESAHRGRVQEIARELYGNSVPEIFSVQRPCETDQLAGALFGLPTSVGNSRHQQATEGSSIEPRVVALGEQAVQHPHHGEVEDVPANSSSDSATGATKQDARRRRLQFDALITCMVSLPPQTQHIIFEAVPIDTHDHLQHAFALQVCAMALKIFANSISTVGMISRCLFAGRRGRTIGDVLDTNGSYDSTLGPVVSELRSISNLTLASTNGTSTGNRLSVHSLDSIRAACWQVEPLCSNVTHLSLRNMTDKRGRIFDLIKSFTSLTDLTISDVTMSPDVGHPGLIQRTNSQIFGDPLWLLFLISLRLYHSTLRLHLGRLIQWHTPNVLPESAVRWLEDEAVPLGAKVDFERETRLTEDFGSFLSMWEMDDGDRGMMAREDEAIGRLVDDAFSSRWKNFANMR